MQLAKALAAGHGIGTLFISGDPSEFHDQVGRASTEFAVTSRSAAALVSALDACAAGSTGQDNALVLHYVNYGFADRGCPFWLLNGLERWKRTHPRVRLVTMFHELYAFGPPWRSSFWLSPLQRHIAKRIWALSDAAITSLSFVARILEGWQQLDRRQLLVLPIFSNVGESETIRNWATRESKIVVLGRAGTEHRVYEVHRKLLAQVCRDLSITEIVDIGPRGGPVPKQIDGVPVKALGLLSGGAISDVLAAAKAGFVDYSSAALQKSTVFAAYAAHGLLPVITLHNDGDSTSLREGEHYLAAGKTRVTSLAERDFSRIATNAHQWYSNHSLKQRAVAIARLLNESPRSHS